MNSGRALEEVLNFSKTIEYQSEGFFSGSGQYILVFGLLAIFLGIILVVYFRQVFGLVLIVFVAFFMLVTSFNHSANEASHNNELEKVKKIEWEREYAQPYLRELPITSTDDFESFAYDYEMEEERENEPYDWNFQERDESEKPVNVTMTNGNDVLFWAEVIYDPELKADYMEYKYLTKELRFDEGSPVYKEQGFQEVKIYTNKP